MGQERAFLPTHGSRPTGRLNIDAICGGSARLNVATCAILAASRDVGRNMFNIFQLIIIECDQAEGRRVGEGKEGN